MAGATVFLMTLTSPAWQTSTKIQCRLHHNHNIAPPKSSRHKNTYFTGTSLYFNQSDVKLLPMSASQVPNISARQVTCGYNDHCL